MTDKTKSTPPHLVPHPKPISAERPIPSELWPDLKGVRTADVNMWPNTVAKWREFCKLAVNFSIVSVDLETDGLRPFHGSRLVGVAMALFDGKEIQAGYWNFRHRGHEPHLWCTKHADIINSKDKKDIRTVTKCEACQKGKCPGYREVAPVTPIGDLKLIQPVFDKTIIAGQNFKFDIKHFHVDGVSMPERVIDSMLLAHLWDENARFYNLDKLGAEMGEKKLGDSIKEYMDMHGLDVSKTGHAQVPWEVESPYAVRDTVLVLKRLQFERERWEAAEDPKLMEVFQVENACTPAVADMEINGMKLDLAYVEAGITRLERELEEITKDIYKLAKKEFDIMSTQQLWQVMEARGLKPLATTPNGAPSLGVNELDAYDANGDEMARLVKAYRTKYKMLNTYFKPFRDDHADPYGFIHSDFFVHGTVSGRMSSREPNLQNMTRPEAFTASNTMRGATAKMIQKGGTDASKFENKFEDSVLVRKCFVPRGHDYSLLYADYSQMELRVFAEYAEEKFILDGMMSGSADIHAMVAKEIFPNFPDKDKDPGLYKFFRQMTKQISFGIIYGLGRNKLAVQLNVPVDESVRMLLLAKETAKNNPELAASCSTLSAEDIETYLEDHRVMSNSRQWEGLRSISKEIMNKVNPYPLEEYLFKDGGHMGLLYSAETFLAKYHARFPAIKKFTKSLDTVVRNRGWIFNKYGRRYHMKPTEGYIGVNRLVQGTTADQVKVAQWRVHRLLTGKKSKLLNAVHDELQIDLHHSEIDLAPKIKEAMEYFPNIKVPMVVDMEYSHTSWAEKQKWEGPEKFLESLEEFHGRERKNTGTSSRSSFKKKSSSRKMPSISRS